MTVFEAVVSFAVNPAPTAAFTRVPTIDRPLVVGVPWANAEVMARIAATAAAAEASPILNIVFLGTFVLLSERR